MFGVLDVYIGFVNKMLVVFMDKIFFDCFSKGSGKFFVNGIDNVLFKVLVGIEDVVVIGWMDF